MRHETEHEFGHARAEAPPFVVLSGCSGGGKSTLLEELARRGYHTVPEPARQIVKEQNALGRPALYQSDPAAFVELVVSRGMFFYGAAPADAEFVFFDRSIIDAVSALERLGLGVPDHLQQAAKLCRYHRKVFLVPPWPEIFTQDAERRHSLADSIPEFEYLVQAYPRRGYEALIIPKAPVEARADFVLAELARAPIGRPGRGSC